MTAGEFGAWTPIGAVQTASGYDVAWKNTASGQYTVWTTDSNGNYTGNLTGGAVSGNSYALESLEPVFNQDLNGDGTIGLTTTVISRRPRSSRQTPTRLVRPASPRLPINSILTAAAALVRRCNMPAPT